MRKTRLLFSYIAIRCRNYEEYAIFYPHARDSHGDIDGKGSSAPEMPYMNTKLVRQRIAFISARPCV